VRHLLPEPFLVLATENPVEFHGTYPLPEAQLDRFLMRLIIGYPDPAVEVGILYSQALAHPLDSIEPVVDRDEILEIQQMVRRTRVEKGVAEYIVRIVDETRHDERLRMGASPRGSLMLFRACQGLACMRGRDYALPDDAQYLAPLVLAHRLVLTSKAKYGGTTKERIVLDILDKIRVPV
jgi:MoxR-like ATPase